MERRRSLHAVGTDRGSHYELILQGRIAEGAELSVDRIPAGRKVVIDVADVTSINSLGVRAWANFLAALVAKASTVIIRRLTASMVSQAGMVKNFLTGAQIESFYAPYCCAFCSAETRKLFQAYDHIPNEIDCIECPEKMLFDDIRETYLAFRSESEQADTVKADVPTGLVQVDPASEETTLR